MTESETLEELTVLHQKLLRICDSVETLTFTEGYRAGVRATSGFVLASLNKILEPLND